MQPVLDAEKKRACLIVNPPSGATQRTLVVLGVQRGGTSMVAGVLRALGVDMGRAGLNHEDPRFIRADEAKLRRVIDLRNSERDIWGFKVPETTLQLDYLEKSLRNPYYICVFRNIAAVADSFLTRGVKYPAMVVLHALKYYNRMGRLAREAKAPLLVVNYERAASNPVEFVDSVLEFIEIDVPAIMRERAAEMVTGDGGGYLDVPDNYLSLFR